MSKVVLALALISVVGIFLTSAQVEIVRRLLRRRRPFADRPERGETGSRRDASTEAPLVSVLKPLSGLDDGLEENLISFAKLEGVRYEVILSVKDPNDPALEIVDRVRGRFPAAPFRLVVGGVKPGVIGNPKVERLVAAARLSEGDVLFVSDSNVRVSPRDLVRTVEILCDRKVGCVSNLFVASGGSDFGAIVEGLHLLTFVLPGTALAASGGVPCVVGKSMALSREALDAIGGFAAFGDVLAEDQAIGLAVAGAGYRLEVSETVVSNVIERRTLARALSRQVRWGKIRYSFSKATYTGELLLNPFAVAFVGMILAALMSNPEAGLLAALAALSFVVRTLQTAVLARLTGADVGVRALSLVPAKDLLQLATQLVPYVSKEVVWHNHRARLGPGTRLMPTRRAATA